mmetsp:Transcript_17630/g.29624  ORF Transcript_17630/g.29624 Transcript_17630/m.29624 type:complete len:592 (-) Transcript_17630:172-1947(-)
MGKYRNKKPSADSPKLHNIANGTSAIKKLRPFYDGPVSLRWPAGRKIGAGLNNLGNTCFLNSVMQCLTYTPPLAKFVFDSIHTREDCRSKGFCALCVTSSHIKSALDSPGKTISPRVLCQNIRQISKCFKIGRQEDAHEFTRYLLEAMQQACLEPSKKVLPPQSETTFVHQAFGGRLRSQVTCTSCKYDSNTYDPFLDLSLEINKVPTIAQALGRFTAVEVLDGQNKYLCSKCKHKVRAHKRFTIDKAPNVLTINLKRFGAFGGKIDRIVEYDSKLDLAPYMSQKPQSRDTYSLYGVLVHSGHSTHSGHYFSFVKSPAGSWHLMDDCQVKQVSEQTVLKQRAYMLFYIREQADRPKPVPPPTPPPPQRAAAPAQPSGSSPKSTSLPNGHSKLSADRNSLLSATSVPQPTSSLMARITVAKRPKSEESTAQMDERRATSKSSPAGPSTDSADENRSTAKNEKRKQEVSHAAGSNLGSQQVATARLATLPKRPDLSLSRTTPEKLAERRCGASDLGFQQMSQTDVGFQQVASPPSKRRRRNGSMLTPLALMRSLRHQIRKVPPRLQRFFTAASVSSPLKVQKSKARRRLPLEQ